MDTNQALFEYLLRLGDDRLVLGHQLSKWCGHAPILEEDIALANIALDLVGHASNLLKLAGQVEGQGRSEDDLAYFREATEFRNIKLVEQPNGDFAHTLTRQFLFDSFGSLLFEKLQSSSQQELAGIAAKAYKEIRYHLRHSSHWMLMLGDGTEESHDKAQSALDSLWTFTDEIFNCDQVEQIMLDQKVSPDLESIKDEWMHKVSETIKQATLTLPDQNQFMAYGSRQGLHSEHLGHMLAEMQIVARSFPGAKW